MDVMATKVFYLLLLVGISAGTQTNNSLAGVSGTNTYYLDTLSTCSGSHQFSSFSQDAYVKAWKTNPHTIKNRKCILTFHSYSNYGIKLRFNSGAYIHDRAVNLDVYDSNSALGVPLVSINI